MFISIETQKVQLNDCYPRLQCNDNLIALLFKHGISDEDYPLTVSPVNGKYVVIIGSLRYFVYSSKIRKKKIKCELVDSQVKYDILTDIKTELNIFNQVTKINPFNFNLFSPVEIKKPEWIGKNTVYFIQAKQLKLIKIGYTRNIDARLSSLNCSCPDELIILKLIEGSQKLEKELHDKFKHLNCKGEWFYPDSELLKYISLI